MPSITFASKVRGLVYIMPFRSFLFAKCSTEDIYACLRGPFCYEYFIIKLLTVVFSSSRLLHRVSPARFKRLGWLKHLFRGTVRIVCSLKPTRRAYATVKLAGFYCTCMVKFPQNKWSKVWNYEVLCLLKDSIILFWLFANLKKSLSIFQT